MIGFDAGLIHLPVTQSVISKARAFRFLPKDTQITNSSPRKIYQSMFPVLLSGNECSLLLFPETKLKFLLTFWVSVFSLKGTSVSCMAVAGLPLINYWNRPSFSFHCSQTPSRLISICGARAWGGSRNREKSVVGVSQANSLTRFHNAWHTFEIDVKGRKTSLKTKKEK